VGAVSARRAAGELYCRADALNAKVAARGQAGGRRHEPARHRAETSVDGLGYQVRRWSNSKAGVGSSAGSGVGSCSALTASHSGGAAGGRDAGWCRRLAEVDAHWHARRVRRSEGGPEPTQPAPNCVGSGKVTLPPFSCYDDQNSGLILSRGFGWQKRCPCLR
jgi:hypothetical protein